VIPQTAVGLSSPALLSTWGEEREIHAPMGFWWVERLRANTCRDRFKVSRQRVWERTGFEDFLIKCGSIKKGEKTGGRTAVGVTKPISCDIKNRLGKPLSSQRLELSTPFCLAKRERT